MISDDLRRYIGVLKKGDLETSLPHHLKGQPVFNFESQESSNESYDPLISELKS